ncbi:MAG: hypothetical protein CL930_08810 [Deltaproteobacteria bacterium]|jgi:hypothetical protein|nr:hypothetical protein [Deltaproteobacteria bacterium]
MTLKQPTANDIPITFSQFVITLVQSTMVHLGEIDNPDTGQKKMNLVLAQDTINVLTLLKNKTHGNLTDDETRLIDGLLVEVRTKFLTASGTYQRR